MLDEVVSCCFGSPFAGEDIAPDDVAALVDHARRSGVDRVTWPTPPGWRRPDGSRAVLDATGTDVGLHLHDTRAPRWSTPGPRSSLGVARFDTALGGLGGSPFAPTAGGNLATEDLVLLLDDAGIETGIDLGRAARRRPVPGRPRRSRPAEPRGRCGAIEPVDERPRRRHPGEVLWTPPADAWAASAIGRFASQHGTSTTTASCIDWSVADLDGFWAAVTEFTGDALARSGRRPCARATRCPACAGSPAAR